MIITSPSNDLCHVFIHSDRLQYLKAKSPTSSLIDCVFESFLCLIGAAQLQISDTCTYDRQTKNTHRHNCQGIAIDEWQAVT